MPSFSLAWHVRLKQYYENVPTATGEDNLSIPVKANNEAGSGSEKENAAKDDFPADDDTGSKKSPTKKHKISSDEVLPKKKKKYHDDDHKHRHRSHDMARKNEHTPSKSEKKHSSSSSSSTSRHSSHKKHRDEERRHSKSSSHSKDKEGERSKHRSSSSKDHRSTKSSSGTPVKKDSKSASTPIKSKLLDSSGSPFSFKFASGNAASTDKKPVGGGGDNSTESIKNILNGGEASGSAKKTPQPSPNFRVEKPSAERTNAHKLFPRYVAPKKSPEPNLLSSIMSGKPRVTFVEHE